MKTIYKYENKTTINIPTAILFIIAWILGIWMSIKLWPWETI